MLVSSGVAVALLVLLARAAWTRFVTANFGNLLRTWLYGRVLCLLFDGDTDNLIYVYINVLDADTLSIGCANY
jgi:hypothetical protein